ncbi:MAG: alpha/beta fold hydrolase [Acidobacteriota bacterium]
MNNLSNSNVKAPKHQLASLSTPAREACNVLLKRHFHPHRWLNNRHIMTIAAYFLYRNFPNAAQFSQQRIFKVAKGINVLGHCGWQADRAAAPTLIIVHGLEGSSGSKYALGTALKAYSAGFNVIRINQRGCGNTIHLSAMPYHAGLTHDLHAIIDELVLNDGISTIYLAGFSLGGNQSLKLAGEYGLSPPSSVKGICAVSVPIDLESCVKALHWKENLLYEWNFLLSLHKSYQQRKRLHPELYQIERPWRAVTMRQFDDLIVGPCNGFRNAEDYYTHASSAHYLTRINIPTLIIQAKDDPFIPFDMFLRTPMSQSIALLVTEKGGHVGYISEKNESEDRYWAENRVVEFFRLLWQEQNRSSRGT